MGISSTLRDDHVRVVTVDFPPVNALPVAGWFELAEALDDAGRDQETHVVVLRAEGKGFNAGVDIKEMQRASGFEALIGANRGCYAAFKAVYECAVPVVAAVHGFCLGGGVGLVGNADVVVASDDAYFGVPEVKLLTRSRVKVVDVLPSSSSSTPARKMFAMAIASDSVWALAASKATTLAYTAEAIIWPHQPKYRGKVKFVLLQGGSDIGITAMRASPGAASGKATTK